ncbi:alpha/beta hydrolase [Candidatus Saccharibacteria bacterium]|nr:alpha/beta hydrolase [Candidatus Saccharibacteria bacterium]
MPKNVEKTDMDKHIQPLVMNGLRGRMLCIPPKASKKREILLIYGQHASIERTYSLADEFSRYGTVTLPDLPGFGGMDALYKIGMKPNLDEMADYLAAFVKLRYKRKRVSIIGVSYGFIVATRMLQRYPELARKVDIVVSIVGFAHYEDFMFKPSTLRLMRATTKLFSFMPTAWFAKNLLLRGPFIRGAYTLVADKHAKFKDAGPAERNKRIKFEIILWKINDIRTYMHTINGMLYLDLCDKTVKLPVYHVSVDGDQYFDNYKVEQHMRVIFTDFKLFPAKLNAHMPTIVASSKEVAPLIPPGLRYLLSKPV